MLGTIEEQIHSSEIVVEAGVTLPGEAQVVGEDDEVGRSCGRRHRDGSAPSPPGPTSEVCHYLVIWRVWLFVGNGWVAGGV